MIENLRSLTQEQRQAAHRAARQAAQRAIGPKPTRDHFSSTTISRYPGSVTHLIGALCLVLLLAAFIPSAIRLYVIGSQTFGQAVTNEVAQVAVGLATVLSAEIGQVGYSCHEVWLIQSDLKRPETSAKNRSDGLEFQATDIAVEVFRMLIYREFRITHTSAEDYPSVTTIVRRRSARFLSQINF